MSKHKITDPKKFNYYINELYWDYKKEYPLTHSEDLLIRKLTKTVLYIQLEQENYISLDEYFEKKHYPKTFFMKDLYTRDKLLLNHFWGYMTDNLYENIEIEIQGEYIPFYDPSLNFDVVFDLFGKYE